MCVLKGSHKGYKLGDEVSSIRHRQSGVSKIAQVSKQHLLEDIPGSEALFVMCFADR